MIVLLNLICMFMMSIYLVLMGNRFSTLLPLLIIWAVILIILWGGKYYRIKKKTAQVTQKLEQLDQKYLIYEMLEKPENAQEKLCDYILCAALKSMLENVNSLKNTQRRYKEYIEEWIHEIKTPITAIDLICKNHPGGEHKRIQKELSRIDYLVEQALYYARSENVEKDYFVKEFPLFDALTPALMSNRTLLLEENIRLQVEETPDTVCTDEKWLTYIMNQILSNSIKYRRIQDAWIRISARREKNGVFLTIEDNGIGISPEDLPRIFEKGFTGSSRNNQKSTGMGLYLCRKLCLKLGLDIRAESVLHEGTKIMIGFPMGNHNHPERRD